MTADRIREYITKQFPLARKRNLHIDEPLLENGILDSLGMLDLVTYLEEEFGISVDDEELVPDNFQTIERLAAFVSQKQNPPH